MPTHSRLVQAENFFLSVGAFGTYAQNPQTRPLSLDLAHIEDCLQVTDFWQTITADDTKHTSLTKTTP